VRDNPTRETLQDCRFATHAHCLKLGMDVWGSAVRTLFHSSLQVRMRCEQTLRAGESILRAVLRMTFREVAHSFGKRQ
jgi:hypothetical protein